MFYGVITSYILNRAVWEFFYRLYFPEKKFAELEMLLKLVKKR